jgi:cytoskeleton protein RodZ
MSKKPPVILSESPESPASEIDPGGLGAKLRKAREHLGLNVEEAAQKLCLSTRQLTALEADDFGALPSPTFTRGFIRNYARLLQLDADPLIAIYREMLPETTAETSLSLHSEGIPIQAGNRSSWLSYLIASVLLGIAGGAWWAYMDWRESAEVQQPANSVKAPDTVAPAPPPPVAAEQPAQVQPMDTAISLPAESPPPSAAMVLPAETPQTPVQVSPSGSRIIIKFTQPSWVRVTDRDGKDIFHKNKPENSEDVIEGNPPFKVEVGNAAGVQLNYNGQPVDLAPHTKANVARFTLE